MTVFVTFITAINEFRVINAHDSSGSGFVDLHTTNFTVPRSKRVDLTGWKLVSEKGNQTYSFPNGTSISAGGSLKILSGSNAETSSGPWYGQSRICGTTMAILVHFMMPRGT